MCVSGGGGTTAHACVCVYLQGGSVRVVVMRREQGFLTQTGEKMCHKTFIRRKRAAKNVPGGGKSVGSQKLHDPFGKS